LNVVGGVRVMDPSADLGAALAVASALLDKPLAFDTAVMGEVGLSAEVRSVSQIAVRLNEAQKLGFRKCIVPNNNLNARENFKLPGLDIIPVTTVRQALDELGR
jgi:DNA repair protein RadA/Sms